LKDFLVQQRPQYDQPSLLERQHVQIHLAENDADLFSMKNDIRHQQLNQDKDSNL
jgi:hypothetical protein